MVSHRKKGIGAALGHGSCNMRIVCARSYHEKSVPLSMPYVDGNVRQTHSLPHPVQRGTPQHPLRHDKRCQPQTVAQRLRPMGQSR